jgi:hypothetical protein
VYFDSSLSAFFKCNLIGVGELVDFFVRSPVLDSCGVICDTLELILSQEMLVIKCIEVSALAFVWEFG